MQERGIERPGAEFPDREVELAGRSGQARGPGADTAGRAGPGALVAAGADGRGCFGVDQVLQASLEEPAERALVGEVGLFEQFADQSRQG